VRLVLLLSALVLLAAPAFAAQTTTRGGTFISTCTFGHRASDDPIVFPRRPGFSHNHTFVGSAATNAFSTLASLRGSKSSCYLYGDSAAYWAPTVYADGAAVTPRSATIYYRRLTVAPAKPFPPGLRMIAGDSHAARPQSPAITHWDCAVFKENFYGTRKTQSARAATTAGIPRCSKLAELQLLVNFPDCWDGKHFDLPDHKSHMAYSVASRCPAGHPVAVPAISLVYNYRPLGPAKVLLSSGGQYSGHADFINSWNQRALTKLVDDCLNKGIVCGAGVVSASAK
jgi:hypothetical protein